MSPQFLTVTEAAASYAVHPQTVRRWIDEGAPCIRRGRVVRVSREGLQQWLADSQKSKINPQKQNGCEKRDSKARQAVRKTVSKALREIQKVKEIAVRKTKERADRTHLRNQEAARMWKLFGTVMETIRQAEEPGPGSDEMISEEEPVLLLKDPRFKLDDETRRALLKDMFDHGLLRYVKRTRSDGTSFVYVTLTTKGSTFARLSRHGH